MKGWLLDHWDAMRADIAKAHKSFTIWFNSLLGMAIVLLPTAQAQMPQLQGYLPANVYHYAMGMLVLGNILLRFKTDCALREKT